jgi:hypothetical protein
MSQYNDEFLRFLKSNLVGKITAYTAFMASGGAVEKTLLSGLYQFT